MRGRRRTSIGLILVIAVTSTACMEDETVPLPPASTDHPAPWDPDAPYDPGIDIASLSPEIDNPLWPAPVGGHWVYEGRTEDGVEHITIDVEMDTREVYGTTARVVRDTVLLDGEMVEDTWDWYAQDSDGNVWYLGEETYEYENGEVSCSDCGAWEAGVDGALPGINMLADPKVGDAYRQEYYAGVAEDLAEVVAVGVTVEVAAGTFEGCIKTRDLSVVARDVEEFKYACPGVGIVLEEEEDERIELLEYSGLD